MTVNGILDKVMLMVLEKCPQSDKAQHKKLFHFQMSKRIQVLRYKLEKDK